MGKTDAVQQKSRLSAASDSLLTKFSKTAPFIVIGAACFCAYYLLNMNTPPIGDDLFLKYEYQNYFVDNITAPPVTKFSQILEGMTLYYNIFRGRVIAQGLTQVFAVYGKQYFNILNSLVFVGITSLVYFHSHYGKKPKWFLYLVVCVTFWFLTPDMMATSLWMAGSLNECWVLFFVLLFLVPYRILISENGEIKHPIITTLFVLPIGFLAGAFNFQSFGLSIGFVVLTIILAIIKQRKLPLWSIVGLISTTCGTLFVLLAPGNKVECLKKYGYTPIKLYFNNFPDNILNALGKSYEVTKVLLLIIVAVVVWLLVDIKRENALKSKKSKKSKNSTEHALTFRTLLDNKYGLLTPCLFFIAAVGSVAVATALPYFDSLRLFFTIFVSFTLVMFSLLSAAYDRVVNSNSAFKKTLTNKYLVIALPVLICLFTMFDFGKEFRVYHRNFTVYTAVVSSIEEKIASGERNIVINRGTEIVPMLLKPGRLKNFIYYWSVTDIGSDPNDMMNKWYAYCFGADTIVSVK